ncbi:MAG: helix-turn-helix domain-containing protein [Roseburia sp.]|jgi:two-component system response regulator YesN|nr:helix-turn-helix domain-containing protein [Roseburia sp.]
MNVLIVDDEIYAVRTIQRCVDWAAAGVDMVLTAFNAAQAKKMFALHEVDIVITDIEMPGESGLALLGWVRENGYDSIAVCLTCHAEFAYAQEAMHHQVMEYVVKPVNVKHLEEIIVKAAECRREEQMTRAREQKGLLWDHHKERLEREFWESLIDGRQGSPSEMLRLAGQLRIDYDVNEQYRLILFSVHGIADRKEEWREQPDLMTFVIHNISRDLIIRDEDAGKTGWKDLRMWAVLPEKKTGGLYENLESFLDVCRTITGAGMTAYLDAPCFGEELHERYQKLLQRDYENASAAQCVIDCSLPAAGGDDAWELSVDQICGWLSGGDFKSLRQYASAVRDSGYEIGAKERFLAAEEVRREIYRCLERYHIALADFWTNERMELVMRSWQSLPDLMEWVLSVSDRFEEQGTGDGSEREMILRIRAYIGEHIEGRISREQIAEHVNFSADYVSRSFKKETGISLSEYIIREKIARAKELIARGEENIGDIAVRLGYSNFSYFSEVFKRIEGVLPSDYKRRAEVQSRNENI